MSEGLSATVRRATGADRGRIADHRARLFAELKGIADERLEEMRLLTEAYLAEALPTGSYRHWFAEVGGEVVAGAGVQLRRALPTTHPTGRIVNTLQALVLNVFTDPGHRGRGYGQLVMEALHDHLRAEGIENLVLHASPQGHPMYVKLGYTASNEMRLWLD
jgi:GNAT superfamily N-acetyltransferase